MAKIELSPPLILIDLPNEVHGKIMDFVSFNDLFNLERVNKRLRDVVLNVVWPKRDTINHETITKYTNYPPIPVANGSDRETKKNNFNDKSVEMLLSRTKHNLKHLDLSYYYRKITSQICYQFYLVPQLISLDLSDLRLTNDTLKVVAISCPMLEKISFVNGLIGNIDNGLQFLSKRCKKIKYLNLSGNEGVPGECFVNIPTGLKYLNLTGCNGYLHADVMDVIVNKAAKNLETLLIGVFSINEIFKPYSNWLQKLNKLRFFQFCVSVGNLPLLDFSSLEEIEMLRLMGSPLITIKNLDTLKHCHKLKGLDLSFYIIKLHKRDLMNIAKFCPLLEELSLEESFKNGEQCEQGLNNIFIKCTNIKYINISGNYKLKGTVSFGNIPTKLRYLKMDFCSRISSEALNHLASRTNKLETLIIHFSTSDGWLNNFPNLRFLVIPWIGENFLDFSKLKELEMLSFEYNNLSNLKTLQSLKHCRKLKTLEISFKCTPDIYFFEALKNCKCLKYCDFFGCENVEHITELIQTCQLKYFAISNSQNITEGFVNTILMKCNSLTYFEIGGIDYSIYKAIEEMLKEKNPQRQNILYLLINCPPFELFSCKWCEVIPIQQYLPHRFSHFTDVSGQYKYEKKQILI